MCPLWTILRNQKVKVCHHSKWKFWDKYCQSCCIARRPPFVCTNWIGSEAIAQILYNASWKIETYFFSTQNIFSCQPSQKSDNPARHPWACVSCLETSFVVAKAKVVLQKKKKNHYHHRHDYELLFCQWDWCCLQIREVVLGLQLNSRILWDFAQKGKL